MGRFKSITKRRVLSLAFALLLIFGPAAEGAVYYSPAGYYTRYSAGFWPYLFYRFRSVPSVPPAQPAPAPPAQSQPTPAPAPNPVSNPQPVPDNPSSGSASYQLSLYEQRVVELVNAERVKAGLKPLQVDLELSRVARLKAEDMRDKNYFSHDSPTYGSFAEMIRRFGIPYRTAGENIAAGYRNPEAVVAAWMASPGHKSNILNPAFTALGVGYASGGSYGHYWVQLFVGR
ncbi:MAG: CAP domain-containing protein [Thermanaeromonas sp.]|uniref:CAP domain-containing protein n=1 Tax=Thermanaeromonas sp. TaxID=2003697 RepID=UPI0024409F8D|nr:CAP domain-containing protein [Thermanaeromonas sp.]MCG0278705.1 CAP domain-containing protein [Thermanaeromonas sp.]